jgi:CheY-like chemotaxis protein
VKPLAQWPVDSRRAIRGVFTDIDDTLTHDGLIAPEALEALGIRFVTARSTQEAMERLRRQHFDVIISDMGREPDEKAVRTGAEPAGLRSR